MLLNQVKRDKEKKIFIKEIIVIIWQIVYNMNHTYRLMDRGRGFA